MSNAALGNLRDVLTAAQILADAEIERVFSPEEVLLAPYFTYLTFAFERALDDTRVGSQLQQAVDYYRGSDFNHCITSLGLIAEDYVTQVYSSFLREPCPAGLTLGQVYDLLHSRIRELMTAPKQEPLPMDEVFAAAKKIQTAQQLPSADDLAQLIRMIASAIKQDRRVAEEKLDHSKGKTRAVSVFPKHLRDCIDEVIRYRNAASHKTRIPLGNYEAQKTLHGLVSLIRWWKAQKKTIQWANDRDTVLRTAIDDAMAIKHQ